MADFDIFNPKISKIVKGIEGKTILIHSDERKLGKTLQATKMPKPFYLRFEQGINAISDIPYADMNSWADFKKVNKQLTNPKTLDEAKKLYTTIIFDTVDVAIRWVKRYVCASQGVERLKDANNGYGAWDEYSEEWFSEISKLTNAGYCVYFIAHSTPVKRMDVRTGEEYEQMSAKGDKRTIDLILDLADIIGYVKSNGLDEDGNEIPSSLYLANTKEFQAGSRFKYLPKIIDHYTAENLQNELMKAIEKQEKEEGSSAMTFDEKKKFEEKKKWNYEEILSEIKKYIKPLSEDYLTEAKEIIYKYLGEEAKITDATKKQLPQLEMILSDFQDLCDEKGIVVEI